MNSTAVDPIKLEPLVINRHNTSLKGPFKGIYRDSIRVEGLGPLRGSWVVISRVIGRVTILITQIRGLITPLITTHEPPSSDQPP